MTNYSYVQALACEDKFSADPPEQDGAYTPASTNLQKVSSLNPSAGPHVEVLCT